MPILETLDYGADELKSKNEKKEEEPHHFAGPPLREPAIEPRENGAGQQQIHQGEDSRDQERPGKQRGTSDPYAHRHAKQPDDRANRPGLEQSVGKAQNKEAAKAKRESQEICEVKLHAHSGGQQRIELPKEKHDPGKEGQESFEAMRHQNVGNNPHRRATAEDEAAHHQPDKADGNSFETTLHRAEGIAEKIPAQPGYEGDLLAETGE